MAAREALSMLTTLSQASEYLPLALECRTQNQFNRLHIHLENILAPQEFVLLADLARRQQFPERSRNWLEKIGGLSPGLFDRPQAFSRRALSENVLFYQDEERAPATKTLLVGFAGDARRLMLPIAVFLQCLDARTWDLVLLRKGPHKRPFSRGVEGVSRHLPSVLNYREEVHRRGSISADRDARHERGRVLRNRGRHSARRRKRRFNWRSRAQIGARIPAALAACLPSGRCGTRTGIQVCL